MTRELDTNYMDLCGKCKKVVLARNRNLIIRMSEKYSMREIAKLTGIPFGTIQKIVPKCPHPHINGHRKIGTKHHNLVLLEAHKTQNRIYDDIKRDKSGGKKSSPEKHRGDIL